MYLDVSQVESATWSLAPWLLDYEHDGTLRLRDGSLESEGFAPAAELLAQADQFEGWSVYCLKALTE